MKILIRFIGFVVGLALSLQAHAYQFNFAVMDPSNARTYITGSISFSSFTSGQSGDFNAGSTATVSNIIFYGYQNPLFPSPLSGSNTNFISGTYTYVSSGSTYYVKTMDLRFSATDGATTTYYKLVNNNTGGGCTGTNACMDLYSSTTDGGPFNTRLFNNQKIGSPSGDVAMTEAQLTGVGGAPEIDGKLLPQALLLVVGAALIRRRSYKQDSKLRMAL